MTIHTKSSIESGTPTRYDSTTIALHWLTVVLVVTLFALAEVWGFLPRGTPLRKQFQSLHISLGIVLALVIALRLGWRATRGRHLPAVATGLQGWAVKTMDYVLYLLLVVQIVLGFVLRWAQAEAFQFFGLFTLQFATVKNSTLSQTVGSLHDTVAWIIIVVAGLHATAALIHHYILKDGLLKRMQPG